MKIWNKITGKIRAVHRYAIAHSSNPRPTTIPYISGDNFRALASHVFDERSSINPTKVMGGDIVFVRAEYIDRYFKEIHPLISTKYTLVTHNDDDSLDDKRAALIDDKIITWHGQNMNTVHPKASPLPIGLENLHYYNNGIPKNFDKVRLQKNVAKNDAILYGFNVQTNPTERQDALNVLEKLPLSKKISGWPNPRKYLKILTTYKFVASPPGNGIDCIRTWEAMYVKTVPIVKSSILTQYFFDAGLPLLLINDWKELESMTAEDLSRTYDELAPRFESKALWSDYWKNNIVSHD